MLFLKGQTYPLIKFQMIPFAKVLSKVSFPAIFSLIVVVLVDNSWLLSKNEQRILQKTSRRIQWDKKRIRAKGPWKKKIEYKKNAD